MVLSLPAAKQGTLPLGLKVTARHPAIVSFHLPQAATIGKVPEANDIIVAHAGKPGAAGAGRHTALPRVSWLLIW